MMFIVCNLRYTNEVFLEALDADGVFLFLYIS